MCLRKYERGDKPLLVGGITTTTSTAEAIFKSTEWYLLSQWSRIFCVTLVFNSFWLCWIGGNKLLKKSGAVTVLWLWGWSKSGNNRNLIQFSPMRSLKDLQFNHLQKSIIVWPKYLLDHMQSLPFLTNREILVDSTGSCSALPTTIRDNFPSGCWSSVHQPVLIIFTYLSKYSSCSPGPGNKNSYLGAVGKQLNIHLIVSTHAL